MHSGTLSPVFDEEKSSVGFIAMKLRIQIPSLFCAAWCAMALQSQTVVDPFEYSSSDELAVAWTGSANATVTISDSVAAESPGTMSMQVDFNFPSVGFATEIVAGSELATPVAIAPTQYLSFRVKGDPAFQSADFRNLYLYAYDSDGNFGRWGAAVPTTADWRVMNFLAAAMEQPWDSPALPDLTRIVRFSFYQYGSEAAIPAYAATIHLDDLTVRDAPLIETAPGGEFVIEAFEYPTTEDLVAAWSGSANAAVTASTDISPRSTGLTAMEVTFNFPSMEWATETVHGPTLDTPVAIGTNQYLSFRVKGDSAFGNSDFRNLYLYVYDADGNFGRWGGEIPTTDTWEIANFLVADIEKPWDSVALPDLNQIVRLAFFQYGSQSVVPAYSATIFIDDIAVLDAPLVETPQTTEFVVETFDYATDDDLLAAWVGSANAVVSLTEEVSPRASGQKAIRIDFSFPSVVWATETVRGPELTPPISIGSEQYITFRIKGDPAFAAADFRNLYLYAYDTEGNFGRWGSGVPITSDWTIVNFRAGSMEQPWDSPALPNLSEIVRFAFFQYGSEAALPEYTASISIDEILIRNSPLTEFPLPALPRTVIENFEGFPSTAELLEFYGYVNSPATTVTTASIESPAPEGSNALALAIDFAAGQYPWGSVRSPLVAPFSFPTNAVLTARFKGDASLASVADAGTTFWITFYDASARAISYVVPADIVTNPEWSSLQATLTDFGDTSAVDIGNLVQWRILVQGWEGTAENVAQSATFYVDDIQINIPAAVPTLEIERDADGLTLSWPESATGYILESSDTVPGANWVPVAGVQANQVPITPGPGTRFFRLKK
jgi:hypothetical protein